MGKTVIKIAIVMTLRKKKKRLHMGALGQYQFNIPIIDAKARKEMEQTKYFKRKWLKILQK